MSSIVVVVMVLYVTRPYKDVLTRVSFATAYPALILLGSTLLTGPFNVLRGRRNPVSSDFRRDIGIWAGLIGTVHAVVGQCVHLRGRPWLYYVYGPFEKHVGLRRDIFGLANYTGALATLLLLTLFVTSNDLALRTLGALRWKAIQRWNYAVFALSAVHSFAYQAIEKQQISRVTTVLCCVVITIAMQVCGLLQRRRALRKQMLDPGIIRAS